MFLARPAHTKQIDEVLLAYFSAEALVIDSWWHELAPQIDVPMENYFQGFFPFFSLDDVWRQKFPAKRHQPYELF